MTKPPPRDWDKELAEIDRLIAKQPAPAPPPAQLPPSRGTDAPTRVANAPPRHRLELTGWLRVLLAVLLAAAMTQWPYPFACGLRLYLYLGAAGVVVIAGLWGSVIAWKRRMAVAHLLSLLVVLWGLVLAGKVVLDRTGYARERMSWVCSS